MNCLSFCLLVACLTLSVRTVDAGCVMNDRCGTTGSIVQVPVPCAVSEKDPESVDTSKLTEQEIDDFESLCTAYANFTSKDTKLCCTATQVKGIISNFETPKSFLNRCPSAMFNFASFFCAITCDPNQSSFLNVTETEDSDPEFATGKKSVVSIDLKVDPRFRDVFFDSVAGVYSTAGRVINILCNDENCTPEKFLKNLGTRDPSAFNIKYQYLDNETDVVPVHGVQCFEAPTPDQWPQNPTPCSCTDCSNRCIPAIDFDDGTEKMRKALFTFDMVLAGFSVVVAVLAVALTVYTIHRRKMFGSMAVTSPATASTSTDNLVSPEANADDDRIMSSIEEQIQRKEQGNRRDKYMSIAIHFWCKHIVFRFPILTILFGVTLVIVMSLGLSYLRMVSDPVLLWSSPDSRARIEKEFFDQNLGPFFRVNTFIVSITNEDRDAFSFDVQVPDPSPFDPEGTADVHLSGIFRKEFMREILSLQSSLRAIEGLSDVCFKPLSTECMVQSPLNFFQSNDSHLDIESKDGTKNYANHLVSCLKNPLLMKDSENFGDTNPIGCLSEWGGPALFDVVFGGFEGTVPPDVGNNYYLSNTTSFIVTFLLNNSVDPSVRTKAEVFEAFYLKTLHAYKNRSVLIHLSENVTKSMPYNLSFYSERSVTDEIVRQSSTDARTITLSYACMLLYIALSLGKITSFIRAKVSLGLAGVAIVLLSVMSSIGFLSYVVGHKIVFNLIIIEVIPFLILAVGVDNIFLMVQSIERRTRDRKPSDASLADELADTIAEDAGPSILISSASEAGCFFIGSIASSMPAVKAFAATASLSLLVLLILQFTVFLSLLFLDTRRERRGRNPDLLLWPLFLVWRCFSCFSRREEQVIGDFEESGGGDGLRENSGTGEAVESCAGWRDPCSLFMARVIVPLVSKFHYLILFLWILSTLFALHSVPRLSVGLDQEVSVPDDSYVKSFFVDQKERMRVGPPLFFVMNTTDASSFDYSLLQNQNLICSSASCQQDSLGNIIKTNSLEQELSISSNRTAVKKYISGHATSWLDEFLSGWLSTKQCCAIKQIDNQTVFCDAGDDSCSKCVGKDGRLESPDLFWFLLPRFLAAVPDTNCPTGGKAAYSFTVKSDNSSVQASYYSTYHLPCKNSSDFIHSIQSARLVADQIQDMINNATGHPDGDGAKVFPYSIFYVFYEQYLSTWRETGIGLSSSLLTVIVILTASRVLKTGCNHLVFVVTLISFMLHLMSGMQTSDIELNAITLVNLIMSIGISVEFTSHFMIAFAHESGHRPDSVVRVLQTTGSSILSGITLTKLIGIIVLGFTTSRIFTTYYFRFYLLLVGVGGVHGLLFLPSLCYVIAAKT